MSTVYQATDRLLQREVAIKVFTAAADSEADIERQQTEARLIASLNHHALTTLLDAGVDTTDAAHPQIYLVMEYIPGDDLRHRLRDGPVSPIQVCWLGFDLCEGLEFVHTNGFLHRDIKPANVLLANRTAETRLRGKLADFGVASLRGDPDANVAMDADEYVLGTAAYLSPEQAAGDPATAASDTYSLGLVLLEALTAEVEFPGAIAESAMARLDRDPVIPDTVPKVIADIVRSMTSSRPQDRISLTDAAAAFRNVIYDDHILQRRPAGMAPVDAKAARVTAIHRYEILQTTREETFDRVTRLASRVLRVPIALITIVDAQRVAIRGRRGLDESEVDEDAPFWSTTRWGQRTPWAVADTRADRRAGSTPVPLNIPHARSYAAAPLVAHDGYSLGALYVFDRKPRAFKDGELETLKDLAEVVMHEMELQLAVRSALLER
jgi:tRNA A-37 threonylcarbamoyl transferase component Bud32